MRLKSILAVTIVFIIAFSIRMPLVDRCYQYSFEPDSESCIEVTRSFYYFFQSPSAETFPQTLTIYPNYSDGDFITCALLANAIRPLCQAGIIHCHLSDSDYSLIIFSMRWGGVLMDALSAAIACMILIMLGGDVILSLIISLLYYLLNTQTLHIDLIRIDHFTLLTSHLAVLSALLLYLSPYRRRYWLLCGIAIGLVSGTKINFPFYLVFIMLVSFYLLYKKKASAFNLSIFIIAILFTFLFIYQRWLMYSENIITVFRFTLHNGDVWMTYWGNEHYLYYLWDQFFDNGFSIGTVILLVMGYTGFIYCLYRGLIKKDTLNLLICITFIIQSAALMFSPKIGRYGTIVPLWISVFLLSLAGRFIFLMKGRWQKALSYVIFIFFLLPSFVYATRDYCFMRQVRIESTQSLNSVRIAAYHWIVQNVKSGSKIALMLPRASNPPIFEQPYIFDETTLSAPFLFKDDLSKFYPPDPGRMKDLFNYAIINSKDKEQHFFALRRYDCDTSLTRRWLGFYHTMDSLYPHYDFCSTYANYGLKSISIYSLNQDVYNAIPVFVDCGTRYDSCIYFTWTLTEPDLSSGGGVPATNSP